MYSCELVNCPAEQELACAPYATMSRNSSSARVGLQTGIVTYIMLQYRLFTVSENEVKCDQHILHHSRLDGKPSGRNCWHLYPLPSEEGVGECVGKLLAQNVVASVHIGVNASAIFGPI